MTAEHVYKLVKAYRLYFTSDYDPFKYNWAVKTQPLINEPRRQFYYKLANKLSDEQIHATLTVAHFYKPDIYITDVVTQDYMTAGVMFDARRENGMPLYCSDLHALRKRLKVKHLDAWLYGELIDGDRANFPGCFNDLAEKTLPLDLACILLLIPRKELDYNWVTYWKQRTGSLSNFTIAPWINRLFKVDRLLQHQRLGWRLDAHRLSKTFWAAYQTETHPTFTPIAEEVRLFA